MIVYTVTMGTAWHYDDVVGVFSDFNKALSVAESCHKNSFEYDHYKIEGWNVDGEKINETYKTNRG